MKVSKDQIIKAFKSLPTNPSLQTFEVPIFEEINPIFNLNKAPGKDTTKSRILKFEKEYKSAKWYLTID
jgi:hypothetical protein